MKIAYFDSGLRWNDPNLRWGSPSYLLEPGDAGYVPPIPAVQKTKKKGKKMKRNPFYPLTLADQIVWLLNFSGKLPGKATELGLTSDQVAAAVKDCLWLVYVLQNWLPAVRSWAQSGTVVAAEAQTGTDPTTMVLPTFAAPPLPSGVVPVAPGAQTRIVAFALEVRNSAKCTDDTASNLGLIGSVQTGPDYGTLQPVITASLMGGKVFIKWGWAGLSEYLDSCEIQVERGDGKGFGLLTVDTTPGYTDTQAFPATFTKWSYRAIYRVGDEQVGVWSQTVSVSVPA